MRSELPGRPFLSVEAQVHGQTAAVNAAARDANSGRISDPVPLLCPIPPPTEGLGCPFAHQPAGEPLSQAKHITINVSGRGAGPGEHPPLGCAKV